MYKPTIQLFSVLWLEVYSDFEIDLSLAKYDILSYIQYLNSELHRGVNMDKYATRASMIDSIIRRDQVIEIGSPEDQVALSPENYEDFDHQLDPGQLSPEFVQKNWLKGSFHKYEIYRKHYLFQSVKRYRDKVDTNYRVNLAWLDPKPEIVQTLAWNWVSSALATAIWAAVLFYIAYFSQLPIKHVDSGAILMSTLTVISLCLFFYSNEHKLIFNSYLSNVSLIELDVNKPDKASFDAFVRDIRSGIYAGWQDKDIQQMLVGEMRELRRLRDAGILTEDTYVQARTAIFNHREYQVITLRNRTDSES